MVKRYIFVVGFFFALMGMFQTDALAGLTLSSSGGSYVTKGQTCPNGTVCQTSICFCPKSYFSLAMIQGGQAPTVIDQSFLYTEIDILQASLACINNGKTDVRNLGQGGTLPIIQFTDLSTGSTGDLGDRDRGRFYVSTYPLCWTAEEADEGGCDPVLMNSVSDNNCRNNQWTPEQYMIQIVKITGQIEDCSTSPCTFSAPVYFYCETKTPTNIVWVEGQDACDPSRDPYCACATIDGTNICSNVNYLCVDFGSPIAWDDSYSVHRTLSVAAPGVLSNDYDTGASPTPLTLETTPVVGPSNGSLMLYSDGSFTYTANAGFSGVDFFTYKAVDGDSPANESNVAKVILKVK